MLTQIYVTTWHCNDVTMSTMASQITSLTIVYSTIYSDTDRRKHQSSTSLAFVWGIYRWPMNSPHKGPVTWKMFPFDDIMMHQQAMWTLAMPWPLMTWLLASPGHQQPWHWLCRMCPWLPWGNILATFVIFRFTGPLWGQWRRALMFSLICARINCWVNNREVGDLRCHRAHYDITVMMCVTYKSQPSKCLIL